MLWIYVIIFIVSVFILVKSGTMLVKSIVVISRYLKISEYVTAFIFMAIVTSLPELFVSVSAAFKKTSSLALGNIIGSNIANLTLILGLVIVFARGIKIKTKVTRREAWSVFFVATLPLLLMWDGRLSRAEGLILLVVYFLYLGRIVRQKERFRRTLNSFGQGWQEFKTFLKSITLFLVGVGLLLGSAWLIVEMASRIAFGLNLPLVFIGLFLVAIGTSLPELVFGVKSVLAKHETMNLGNLLGSCACNSALVLGLVAIIYPIEIVHFSLFFVSVFFMIITFLFFNLFLRTKAKLSYQEGFILLGFYLVFIIVGSIIK